MPNKTADISDVPQIFASQPDPRLCAAAMSEFLLRRGQLGLDLRHVKNTAAVRVDVDIVVISLDAALVRRCAAVIVHVLVDIIIIAFDAGAIGRLAAVVVYVCVYVVVIAVDLDAVGGRPCVGALIDVRIVVVA